MRPVGVQFAVKDNVEREIKELVADRDEALSEYVKASLRLANLYMLRDLQQRFFEIVIVPGEEGAPVGGPPAGEDLLF